MMTLQERREYIMHRSARQEGQLKRFPTLREMALEYKYAADTISEVLKPMRKEYKTTDDPDRRNELAHRIYELQAVLANMHAMAEMCERYYDRNYHAPAKYSFNIDRTPIKVKAADIAGVEQEIESFRGVIWGKETAEVTK